MKIDTGKLNKRITLLTNEVVNGEIVPKSVTVWAEKKSANRAEFYASYQPGLNVEIVFKLRESAYDLSKVTDADGSKKHANSVVYDGKTYNIVRNFIEDRVVELVCN